MALDRPVRIVAFAGSIRRGSFNQTLLDLAVGFAEDAGADVDHLTLADYDMPIYNADLQMEHGIPECTHRLYRRIMEVDAVLIASPEYNAGYTPLLKNTIDWLSRVDKYVFLPRKVGLIAGSPGGTAGAAVLAQTTQLFQKMFVQVHEPAFGLGRIRQRIIDGVLVDEEAMAELGRWTHGFVATAAAQAEDPPRPPGD